MCKQVLCSRYSFVCGGFSVALDLVLAGCVYVGKAWPWKCRPGYFPDNRTENQAMLLVDGRVFSKSGVSSDWWDLRMEGAPGALICLSSCLSAYTVVAHATSKFLLQYGTSVWSLVLNLGHKLQYCLRRRDRLRSRWGNIYSGIKILKLRNGHGTMMLAFCLNMPFTHFLTHCI